MNNINFELAKKLIPATYVKQAEDAKKSREKMVSILLTHQKMPSVGWPENMIELFLNDLSAMDSNNFPSNCGLGEREARIISNLVAKRHYRFGHGIGRSGDLTEPQPKAAGSSLIQKLTNKLVEDLFVCLGMQKGIRCLITPVATSMTLVLTMLSLKQQKPAAKYVLWSRIDQKACFKSIITAGCVPIIVDTVLINDQLCTNIELIEKNITDFGGGNILCVLSTTSCFAPRIPDDILKIGKLCEKNNIFHVINNAYGMQDQHTLRNIQTACRNSRVDAFIQSTDKNLMVPLGGSIIASFNADLINHISNTYPGRASFSPIIDVFITLLTLGKAGYLNLVNQRKKLYQLLLREMTLVAEEMGETILNTPDNPISIAMTLKTLQKHNWTKFGSMLFLRNVSGTRVITAEDPKVIAGYQFDGWGSHTDSFKVPYLTSAAAIGVEIEEIHAFIKRLRRVFAEIEVNTAE